MASRWWRTASSCARRPIWWRRARQWGEGERETARVILDRIAAQARARAFREVRARFAGCDDALLAEARERFGVATPFGGPTSSGMLTLHCPPDQVYALTSFLREHGAEAVAVADLDYVFSRDNPLFAKLDGRIKPSEAVSPPGFLPGGTPRNATARS